MPSLGMLTVNALAASDQVLIPVQANYLSAKGLEQLLQTVNKVKRQINPKLRIEGILLTMVDFINDEEFWPGIGLQDFVIALFVPGDRTLQKEVCHTNVFHCYILL